MRYTQLGSTGMKVSVVGFGGIPIRRVGHAEAVAVVRRAYDLGVTFFDTARKYDDSEDKIGDALAEVRDGIVLASKTPALTGDEALADVERSLRALRTEYIDLYQLHNVNTLAKLEAALGPGGAVEALRRAQAAGKIGHIGITTHSRDVALAALPSGAFASAMLALSYLEPEATEKVLPLIRQLNLGFISMKPFSGGALNTPSQCIRWVLGQPGVSVVIPGMGSLSEVEEDVVVADADRTLTPADLSLMEQVKAEAARVHCRGCDYCQPCTNDIPISTVLRSVSLVRRGGVKHMANGQYERITAWVADCSECRECEPRCPYELAIPDLLRQRLVELQDTLRAAGWAI